ncbi:hypothetical protein AGABI1DRAFT_129541 [Agaricus bisporus var. burnettii JB137-S8]|uniref:Uncharacterized protein n=1 Tax=Agaricus bisporus var. burnettii (strain JB137-S8 / ATCC MYA-4627 / FGSC 10392) TaxID=597362 RepID=K5WSN9_AGABU|nr:uncharacterized protein AGABI1DRAFT_129541 [Agaricus bisporus var. burnettii JB137-S8]EKM78431.1 hypothetical protein AGABI1DRAFT_129541 [Agaricus bisporus var. burnettii JB137-S8]
MGILDEFYANNDTLRVPNPSHRHAAPSAPWPWVDLGDEFDRGLLDSELPPVPPLCDHTLCGGSCWKNYPESRFPNWTEHQVEKCDIQRIIKKRDPCRLHVVDVDKEGIFTIPLENGVMEVTQKNIEQSWKAFVANERPPDLRVRAVFIEDLSGPVLQMLGAKFNIEPFFWSSSLNWIPTRFQEDPQAGKGDHITICLTFLRATLPSDFPQNPTPSIISTKPSTLSRMMIDTQAPLPLSTGHLLVLDFLSVHMIRNSKGSTIISYHPSLALPTTKAHDLHQRIELAGRSVYWQKMFQISSDPTFVMLIFLWHAMYAWDEAMENLYTHICNLETRVIETNEMRTTNELHVIRAHQLHYHELLENFRKSVEFVMKYPNPTYDNASEQERKLTKDLLERECNQLLAGINRLEMSRKLQDKRLKNVMNLVFSSVNLDDSRRMQRMTEAAVRDSSGIDLTVSTASLTISSFVAAVFGMNVKEISEDTQGTLPHYIVAAAGMTIATVWIIMAYQCQHFLDADYGFLMRLLWPILFILKLFGNEKLGKAKNDKKVARGGSGDIEMQERPSFYPSRDRAASAP